MIDVAGIGELRWLGDAGSAAVDGGGLSLMAPPRSDWFNDPMGPDRHASAPALVFAPDGDVQLSACVTVDFAATFDAGVLFVHLDGERYAKLCFEYSPDREPMVVSVVTREVSDDANGPVVRGERCWLRISRMGAAFAFHHSNDGMHWALTRLFSLGSAGAEASIGFMAQSPTGDGCRVEFTDIGFAPTTLTDARDGS
ncbi:MAG: DUF1349 domain-containing protein [Actinomycetota bacterium]